MHNYVSAIAQGLLFDILILIIYRKNYMPNNLDPSMTCVGIV